MLHSNPGDYAWGQSGLDAIVTQVRGTCAGGRSGVGSLLLSTEFFPLRSSWDSWKTRDRRRQTRRGSHRSRRCR